MNDTPIDKLCLGTAQFGLDYGIANKRGKISKKEALKILNYAQSEGIGALDTAYLYGESEKVIGEFVESNNSNFKIISKLPSLNKFNGKNIEIAIYESLSNLKTKSIYGYLVHEFGDFLKYDKLWSILEELKTKKIVEKIGFSIYTTTELKTILDRDISFDILQVPYSVFDRRFEDFFPVLKEKGIEIYVRSVFLQGLAFLEPDRLTGNLLKAQDYIKRLQNLSIKYAISINALCLNFALLNSYIDKAIIGVDSLIHLKKNTENVNLIQEVKNIHDELDDLMIKNEDLVLPYKWSC